jgi:amino-acid N-acetyltransferase
VVANYNIRPAEGRDANAIRALVIKSHINPTGLDWKRFIVAIANQDEIIGCGQIKPHRDGSLELASIAVTHAWRGKGAARAIIEHLLAAHQGVLYLMCQSSLGPLYEKFGFEVILEEQMPKYFRRVSKLAGMAELMRKQGETLLVMQRG